MSLPFRIDCAPPVLIASFREPHEVLSWTITHPGMHTARRVAWLEVRNEDLPSGIDALSVIRAKRAAFGLDDAPTLVTSRDIRRHHVAQAGVESSSATCLATVGLSNGERVGQRSMPAGPGFGTVNLLVRVAEALSMGAFLETLSIVAQARTTAILEAGIVLEDTAITGTGTDCIAIAALVGDAPSPYAGLHTALGEAVGRCTLEAVRAGIVAWKEDIGLD